VEIKPLESNGSHKRYQFIFIWNSIAILKVRAATTESISQSRLEASFKFISLFFLRKEEFKIRQYEKRGEKELPQYLSNCLY
jgi:hypothetical protein